MLGPMLGPEIWSPKRLQDAVDVKRTSLAILELERQNWSKANEAHLLMFWSSGPGREQTQRVEAGVPGSGAPERQESKQELKHARRRRDLRKQSKARRRRDLRKQSTTRNLCPRCCELNVDLLMYRDGLSHFMYGEDSEDLLMYREGFRHFCEYHGSL